MPQLSPSVAKKRNKLLGFFKEKTFGLLSGQGPASSMDCPAIDMLEFLSTGNELKLLTLGRPIYLLPQCKFLAADRR